jgi:hypothetical protein
MNRFRFEVLSKIGKYFGFLISEIEQGRTTTIKHVSKKIGAELLKVQSGTRDIDEPS